jgi:hypothetical protein
MQYFRQLLRGVLPQRRQFNSNRLLLAIALSGALAAVTLSAAGIAWSAGVLDNGPPQIRVYGGGQVATPTPTPRIISLTASANPQGREAYGSFRYAAAGTPGRLRGDVTCLTVAGNNALLGGFIREGSPNAIGLDFLYAVTDSGLPGSGADTAGFIDIGPELDNPPYPGLPPDFPRTCPADIIFDVFGVFPLTGDVSIEMP